MSWRYINAEPRTRQERLAGCFHCHPIAVDHLRTEEEERGKEGFNGDILSHVTDGDRVSSEQCLFSCGEGFGEVFTNPVSFHCHHWNNGISSRGRNDRERNRVRLVNSSFALLRKHLPVNCWKEFGSRARKLTKVQILRSAIVYIRHLQCILDEEDKGRHNRNTGQPGTVKATALSTMETTKTTITMNSEFNCHPPLSSSETKL